jgi:hypothetical protein
MLIIRIVFSLKDKVSKAAFHSAATAAHKYLDSFFAFYDGYFT